MKHLKIDYKWKLIIMFWFAYFLNQGDRQIYNVVIPLIKEDLRLTDIQLGLVATVFTAVYGCLVPFGGYLGDFIKRKWIVFTSLMVFSLGTLLTGFSGGFISLIILRGITTGGGEAFYYPAATSLISQYHQKTRAMAMSIHQTSVYVGIVASGFIAAYIGENFGWRYSFFTFGLGGIILAIYLSFRMEDTPQLSVDEKRNSMFYAIKEIFKKKTVWMICLAFGGMVFVNMGYLTWMSTFYHENYNLSLSKAGFTSLFFHFALALAGVLTGGKISDKFALKRKKIRLETEFWGLFLGAPFIFIMGYTSNLYVSYAALALFGFFRGVYDSNLYAALFDVIEPHLRASSVGIMTAFAFLIGSLSPLILGMVKTHYGLSIGVISLSIFYIFSALMILIALLFFFKKDYCEEIAK
ncbi:MAG: MFS transporter [Tannerellaceae bacterium]|jgi:MFS family permease|nr:MFS transporter [Tannerellaceae bacterium]